MLDRRGVTLTELVVVMVVISILAAVSMPVYRAAAKRAREVELRRDLRMMRDAIDAYKKLSDDKLIQRQAGSSGYPKTLEELTVPMAVGKTAVVTGAPPPALPDRIRLLRKVPTDPMTGKAEWGMRSNADEPDSSMWGGEDVFDVYSKSDGVALDGTYYKDW